MNAFEARLAEALRQDVEDVHVSDQDLDRLEAEFTTAVKGPTRGLRVSARSRGWQVATAIAAAVALVAGGYALGQREPEPVQPAGAPAQEQPLVPPELVGLWRNVPYSPWLWEITADGRIGQAPTASSYLVGDSVSSTITRRVGDVFTVDTDIPTWCSGEHRIRTSAPGVLTVTTLNDSCEFPRGSELLIERVSPGQPGPRAVLPIVEPLAPFVVDSIGSLQGSWLHVESGSVLAVGLENAGPSLTYVIDDDGDGSTNPDQRGLISMAPDGSTQVRPFAQDTPGCGPRFTKVISTKGTLTTTSSAGGCFPVGSQQTWVKLN